MPADEVARLEALAGVGRAVDVAAETRLHLSSPTGLRRAAQLADHLSAYNATSDLVPFFGDHRLPHTEAHYQLQNSVSLAYHGFYSQSFSTLRSVCELSLLQASLSEGDVVSDEKLDLLSSMLPPGEVLPGVDQVNWVFPLGFGAKQSPNQDAESLEEWAINGSRTPWRRQMLGQLLDSDVAKRFDSETHLSARLGESMGELDSYVHTRGRLRSATGLSNANFLRFSEDSLSMFTTRMMCATQVSVAMLLLAFLPSATSVAEAAAGFIDDGDLHRALSILPAKDAELLRAMYDERDG
ncbi:MAG: hypothetical protein Q8K89_10340 [Actinomycetota bacterium]|nr:hypothetical protein [Actinomycetota bacterium]